MDLTVYLPDDIGERAKAAEINFSLTLRNAVVQELERRAAMTKTLEETEQYEVTLVNREGLQYDGRISGKLIDREGDASVYLTDDGRVIIHDEFRESYEELSADEAAAELEADRFPDAIRALGGRPVVDL